MTLRKIYNLLKLYLEFLLNKKVIKTKPSFLKIEASRKCQINCKYCVVKKEDRFFSKESYENILDKLYLWLFEVSLYDIGEPLWCPDLFKYIKYANKRNVGTSISTTLSIEKDNNYWNKLVLSGLDYLIVSIDGVSNETYRKYRTNGNLDLVMNNLQAIIIAKNKYNSKLHIEWQMIEFEWNKHEIVIAKKMAKELGLSFNLIQEITKIRDAAQKDKNYFRKKNCLLPYIIFVVNVYGEVNPCFKYYNEFMKIGDMNNSSFEEVWNNSEIQKIRDKNQIQSRKICCKCIE